MSKSMLLYTKKILKGVSFDVELFCKELKKAYKVLLPHELEELTDWVTNLIKQNPELKQCVLEIR